MAPGARIVGKAGAQDLQNFERVIAVNLIGTFNILKKAKKDSPVSNISYYELEAFAKWVNLNIPHELQWEVSHNKIINKFNVWEWCNNKFFPYEGFKPYPYKEYSVPWFNKNYYTLKSASIFSEKELKRKTFRNFNKANVRYIFSGGRLSKS